MTKKACKTKLPESIQKDAIELAKFGLSYSEMEMILDAEPGSIERLSKRSPGFRRDLETAPLNAVIEVEKALLKRALGYWITEEFRTYIPADSGEISDNPEVKLKETKIVKKFVPPDSSAALIYLYNIRGKRWSKNPESQSGITVEEYMELKRNAQKQAEENM
ncbi:MAG TPA: hypothetical protein PKE39_14995 [Ignavibacteria bacterium]|nr:hypothetical protein [Ignavibacteria bacterium]HMR00327.1 hypothetical protein [Ignavibacteria bacterium]